MWGGGGRLFEFKWEWEGGGVRVGAYLRLGASSRLGAYSNKYGMWMLDSAKTLGGTPENSWWGSMCRS